ncbi:MAG: ABC-type transport auxiliary lipoprotein family protein [Pseudomonadota bacterium]|jgi:cholesterol transport system auxiliary component
MTQPITSGIRILFTCVTLIGLSACGLINLPGGGPAPNLYDLSPKSTFDEDLPSIDKQLLVEEPSAARGLNSDRIALRPSPIEIKYFAGVRWADRAPHMVQVLLVESFENTGRIIPVGRQSIGLRPDYSLKSDLREFQAEYFQDGSPKIHVRLNTKLVKMPEARIVASRTFDQIEPASGTDTTAIVQSFDETLGKVMRQAAQWTLREINRIEATATD